MKTVTGVVIGLFTIVLVFFGFGLRANTGVDARQPAASQAAYAQPAGDARVMVQPANAFTASGAQALPVSATAQADPGWQAVPTAQQAVLVNCGAGTQTLVRPVWLNGQQVSQVECVPAAGAAYAGRPVQTVAYESPVYDARMARPQATYQQPAPRRVVTRAPQRSWTKTALVIGGTTAAGAGVGGLIGGKKGALIGAALGGGAGTIFEVQKRH
jgi:hypothetical protein